MTRLCIGQNGGKVARVAGERRARDEVHATVDPAQPPAAHPAFDRAPADAERTQLPPRHQPMLPARQRGYR